MSLRAIRMCWSFEFWLMKCMEEVGVAMRWGGGRKYTGKIQCSAPGQWSHVRASDWFATRWGRWTWRALLTTSNPFSRGVWEHVDRGVGIDDSICQYDWYIYEGLSSNTDALIASIMFVIENQGSKLTRSRCVNKTSDLANKNPRWSWSWRGSTYDVVVMTTIPTEEWKLEIPVLKYVSRAQIEIRLDRRMNKFSRN